MRDFSAEMKEHWADPVFRKKLLKRFRSPAHRERARKQGKLLWKNKEWSEVTRKAASKRMKRLHKDKVFQRRLIKLSSSCLKKLWKNPRWRAARSVARKKLWADPNYRSYMIGRIHGSPKRHTSKAKARSRKRMLDRWADPSSSKLLEAIRRGHKKKEYVLEESRRGKARWAAMSDAEKARMVKRFARSWNIRPTRPEQKLKDVLRRCVPGQFRYIGNLRSVIAGKCPDFINRKKKMIIELFGDYWHRGQTGMDRVALFKNHGYRTLIVWERELKDERELLKRIKRFVGK